MITKVFFEDKPVFLTNELAPSITALMPDPKTIYFDEISPHSIDTLLHNIKDSSFSRGILYNSDFNKIKNAFYKSFKVIRAAGGVVKNEAEEILFIFRRGKWDLPKGKNDGDESSKDCALREVREETGLQKVTAHEFISTTYHVYKEAGRQILKETDWFNMKALSQEKLIPQLDEGIEKIEWVSAAGISDKLKNSYSLIADVLLDSGLI